MMATGSLGGSAGGRWRRRLTEMGKMLRNGTELHHGLQNQSQNQSQHSPLTRLQSHSQNPPLIANRTSRSLKNKPETTMYMELTWHSSDVIRSSTPAPPPLLELCLLL